jgi:serine/threonine protein kinase
MSSHYLSQVAYTREAKLGEGAFGTVYKAYAGENRAIYAVKDIKCTKNEDLDSAIDEIRALGNLVHTNIIKLYNVKVSQTDPFQATLSLLLEYCGKGNLNDRLNRSSSRRQNFSWMRQIINAVEFLHKHETIHRDLKPQNVLLTSSKVIKLADFGLATRFGQKNDNQSWYSYYIELGIGQACYVAPEILSQRYTYKVDIFAVGVMFYAILERTFQVVSGENVYGVFVGNRRQPLGLEMFNKKSDVDLQFTRTTPQAVVQLLKRTLKFDYKQRPTAEEIRVILERNSPSNCVIS